MLAILRVDVDLRPECYPATTIPCGENSVRAYRIHPGHQPRRIAAGRRAFAPGWSRRSRFRLPPVKQATELCLRRDVCQTPTSHQLETLVLVTADFACECGGSLEVSNPRIRSVRMAGLAHLIAPSARGWSDVRTFSEVAGDDDRAGWAPAEAGKAI